jgi:hypothetical protein
MELDAVGVDEIAPWLMRLGIDRSGKLDPNLRWDIAIRGAVLAELWLSGRISDAGETYEIDTVKTGAWHLDTAVEQLISSGLSQLDWIGRGRLRSIDLAHEFVRNGEWTMRRAYTATRWRLYRTPERRLYDAQHARLAAVVERKVAPASAAEATLALLGHALNIVQPEKTGRTAVIDDRSEECGAAGPVVSATLSRIQGTGGAALGGPGAGTM